MTKDERFLVEHLANDLVGQLMSDYAWDIQKAMDVLYNSETFSKLEDPRSGLYYQSLPYVYSYLKSEVETGKMA